MGDSYGNSTFADRKGGASPTARSEPDAPGDPARNTTFAERSGAENKQVDAAEAEAKSDPVVCDECGFEAKSPSGLAAHQRSHDA